VTASRRAIGQPSLCPARPAPSSPLERARVTRRVQVLVSSWRSGQGLLGLLQGGDECEDVLRSLRRIQSFNIRVVHRVSRRQGSTKLSVVSMSLTPTSPSAGREPTMIQGAAILRDRKAPSCAPAITPAARRASLQEVRRPRAIEDVLDDPRECGEDEQRSGMSPLRSAGGN